MSIGVLYINTGTPDKPTVEAIGNYLGEFLMDPAIIGAPKFIRKRLVSHIVKARPHRTVEIYKSFWTPQGSPFMIASKSQAELLQASLEERLNQEIYVALAMRYGNPSIINGLKQLREAGCETVILLPAYPQQVNVCAGTCLKEANRIIAKMNKEGWNPEVYQIPFFYHFDAYREALKQSVQNVWEYKPGSKLILSFHSTLLNDIEKGDPYRDQVEATRDNLAADLGIPVEDVLVGYHSRFDNRKWLQPFTKNIVADLAEQGVMDICIACPVFVASNIETVIEVGRDLRADFLEAAKDGASFTYVPELNESPKFIEALSDAVIRMIEAKELVVMPEIESDTAIPGMTHHGLPVQ